MNPPAPRPEQLEEVVIALTVYATPDDLQAWIEDDAVPCNAAALLRSATFLVALACQRNPFGDVPSESDADPLKDATLAQVAAWITLGIDPTTLGIEPAAAPVKKSSMLGADVERDTSKLADAQLAAARELCPESVAILTATGLLWMPTAQGDACGALPHYGLSGARLGVDPTWATSTDAWPFL